MGAGGWWGDCADCCGTDNPGDGDGMTVLYFPGTRIPAEAVPDGAKDAKLESVLVVGYGPDGLYVACSDDNMAEINLLADRLKARIMDHIKNDFED